MGQARRDLWGALLALCLAGLLGCGSDDELTGSLSEVYRIEYNRVRVRLYESSLSVEYVGAQDSVPVRVTVAVTEDAPRKGQTYDLLTEGALSGRLVDGTELPSLLRGSITLDEFRAEQGATVAGEFEARVLAGDDELTLGGTFSEDLEVIDAWPPEPDLDAGVSDEMLEEAAEAG